MGAAFEVCNNRDYGLAEKILAADLNDAGDRGTDRALFCLERKRYRVARPVLFWVLHLNAAGELAAHQVVQEVVDSPPGFLFTDAVISLDPHSLLPPLDGALSPHQKRFTRPGDMALHRRVDLPNFHPSKGFTVAQFGPPSFPVPGTRVSRTASARADNRSIVSHVIPFNGIFSRRLQQESAWLAYVPMSI